MKEKLEKISNYLKTEGFKKQASLLRRCNFTENYQVTFFVNQTCELKVEQMDKVLKTLNS